MDSQNIEILEKELAYDRLQAEIMAKQIKYAEQQAKILEKELFLLKAKNTGSSTTIKIEKKEDKRKTSEPQKVKTKYLLLKRNLKRLTLYLLAQTEEFTQTIHMKFPKEI